MGASLATEGAIGSITLDNPPANSYDLAFMSEFSAAVDEALVSAARVVVEIGRASCRERVFVGV